MTLLSRSHSHNSSVFSGFILPPVTLQDEAMTDSVPPLSLQVDGEGWGEKLDVLQPWKIIEAKAPKVICFLQKALKFRGRSKYTCHYKSDGVSGAGGTPEVFWKTYDAAAGNVLAMTGHGSPRMFKGFNDLRWCRNEIFMVLFLQSSVFVLNVQYLHMLHWAHEQHFAALSCWKVSGLRLFGYHFQDQNALLDVWGVQTYMSNIPKTQRWFGSIFEAPHQKQIHHDEHPFVYPWMLSGVWFWLEYFCQVFTGNCKKADFVMLKIFHERVDRFTTQILRWRPQIQVTLLSNDPENSRKPKDPPKCETKFTCCEFFL